MILAKRRVSKTAKRRLVVLTPIVVLAVGYLCFTLATAGYQLYKLHHEEAKLKEELNNLKGDSEDLKTEINKLQDRDYVARYARENYLYTKDGEYVIKVDTEEKKQEKNKFEITDEYMVYGMIGLGILLILYIILKHNKKKKKKKKKKA